MYSITLGRDGAAKGILFLVNRKGKVMNKNAEFENLIHLKELRKNVKNMDRNEASCVLPILIRKYPDLMFELLEKEFSDMRTVISSIDIVMREKISEET